MIELSRRCPENSIVSKSDEQDQSDTQFIPHDEVNLDQSTSNVNPNSIAIESNTQIFYNKNYQIRYEEYLYFKDDSLSAEFKRNLIIFHIVFSLILLNKFAVSIVIFFTQPKHWPVLTIIIILVSLLLAVQALVFLFFVQNSKFKQKILVVYGILTFSGIVFLGFSDFEAIFADSGEEIGDSKQGTLAILLIILITRDLFFNNPFLVKILGLSGIIVQISVYLWMIRGPFIHFISISYLMIVGVIYLILYSSRLDFKQKRYFTKLDSQKQVSEKLANKRKSDENYRKSYENSLISDREMILSICSMISFLLKQIQCLDLVTEMKTEIKHSLNELGTVKDYIINLPVMLTEEISIMLKTESSVVSRQDSLKNQQISAPNSNLAAFGTLLRNTELKKFKSNFIKDWNFDITSSKLQNIFVIASQESLLQLKYAEVLPNPQKFYNLIESIEKNYLLNPFHNSLHAVDVLHSFLFLLVKCSSTENLVSVDCLSSIVAALGHDVGHPGKDNLYLKEENNELCSRFNFNSVLENMHCALIFELMRTESCKFLDDLVKTDQSRFRKNLICLVLGTDFSTYKDTAGKLSCLVEEKKMYECFNSEKASFVFSVALKCGDVGYYAKDCDLFRKWDQLLIDEYNKLQIKDEFDFVMNEATFIMNNRKFTEDLVIPLFKSWNLFSSLNGSHIDVLLENIKMNLQNKPSFDSQNRISTFEGIQFTSFA